MTRPRILRSELIGDPECTSHIRGKEIFTAPCARSLVEMPRGGFELIQLTLMQSKVGDLRWQPLHVFFYAGLGLYRGTV